MLTSPDKNVRENGGAMQTLIRGNTVADRDAEQQVDREGTPSIEGVSSQGLIDSRIIGSTVRNFSIPSSRSTCAVTIIPLRSSPVLAHSKCSLSEEQ